MLRLSLFSLALASLVPCMGCNNGEFTVHPAKGIVTCGGVPVSGGSISFTPQGKSDSLETGKPASATIDSDGKFTLSTYGRFDGAIVGTHSVTYLGGDEEDNEEADGNSDEETENRSVAKKAAGKRASPACKQTKDIIVEVKGTGVNDFKIEL